MTRVSHIEDLAAILEAASADELCRWLIAHPRGLRRTLTWEATSAFERLHPRGADDDDAAIRTASLLCTDVRWKEVTGKLVEDIEATGVLSTDALDDLAHAFLFDRRLDWVIPDQWVRGGTVRTYRGKKLVPGRRVVVERVIQPPLRRWAAARSVAADDEVVGDVMGSVEHLPARDGDAILQGLLDSHERLTDHARDALIGLGLRWSSGTVRRVAMQAVADRDGAAAASLLAARDPSEKNRLWGERLARRTAPATHAPSARDNDADVHVPVTETDQATLF